MTRDELMELCVNELPSTTLKVKNGKDVIIQALNGSILAETLSQPNMNEKLYLTLKHGLKEPMLNNKELRKFIDYGFDMATDIFEGIMKLSEALSEEELLTTKEIKKN
jgi:hypothetical protein